MKTFEEYLRESAVSRRTIDIFLDMEAPSWARFDPEVGYVLSNYMPRDGIHGSLTISTAAANGARTATAYADRPCRINTYGDSFTQCHQVSDGETWQEYLAAHLGEPIRNFGMGGFGVYQAYRRMRRIEEASDGAKYIILYVWGDDHFRSCMRCRLVTIRGWTEKHGAAMFHGNFWANVEMDLESGRMTERDSLLPTRESLYRMTDPDFMAETMKDDLMVQLYILLQSLRTGDAMTGFDEEKLNRLAEILGCRSLNGDPAERRDRAAALRDAYGFRATAYILDSASEYAAAAGKELMVVLFCPVVTRQLIEEGRRYDQPVVDHIRRRGYRCFDMNLFHVEDFKSFNLSPADYWKRYSIGHYTPAGNHLFAYAIRQSVVDWLEPKPLTYRSEEAAVDFSEYLPQH